MFTPKSEKAKKEFINSNESYKAMMAPDEATHTSHDVGAIEKYYVVNETGNVMVATTNKEDRSVKTMNPDLKQLFQKVQVFFTMWTAALNNKGKDLFDYEALNQILSGSGYFARLHEEARDFTYEDRSLTISAAIINNAVGAVSEVGGAFKIAQRVLDSLGSQLRIESTKTTMEKKVAHVLFVCEDLMGMAIVSVMLFYTTAKESESVLKTNCGESYSHEISFKYFQDTYMFVDPDVINKYTPDFQHTKEYDSEVKKLASLIK